MRFIYACCLILLVPQIISAETTTEEANEDNLHARTWNRFVKSVLNFHRKRVKNIDIEIKEKIGGYAHLPDFYIQKDYYNKGKLIATVMWESEKPDQLHSIEVYIHDKQGRVIRDYTVAYLPHYRTTATQTLISLHRYNNGLHAFRTFDASGYRITERCTGTYKGRDIELLLDEDEIAEALEDAYIKQGIMMTSDYKNCFGYLQQELGKYITPQ